MRMLAYFCKIRVYLLILGGLCLCFGIYQKYWYADPIMEAVKAIEANQLDEQYLDRAKKSFIASEDLVSYNMGVRGYRAKNLKRASQHFYDVIRESRDSFRRKRAFYNLGGVLVQLNLPKEAAEMYRESLRIDPTDWEAKYNLERLYVFFPMAFPDEKKQASMDQEPGNKKEDQTQMGRKGAEQPDI